MAGTASPGAPGPSVAPPPLPSGWIAQWDETTRKYYYVELGTGRSQWDVPTEPAPTAISTPASAVNHPYGVPPASSSPHPANGARIITHPDGSQTIQHPDGRMEPILPGGAQDGPGTRGVDGPSGDRGLGTFAQSALNSFAGSKQGGGGSNPLGNLASSLLGGGGGGHGGGGGGGAGGFGGKVVSGLASSLFSSGNDKPQPQNYHGGPQVAPHHSGGLAGSVMGGVASMFGGNQNRPHQNFGYSNTGPGSYSGQEPPISYQPPSQPGTSTNARSAPQQHQPQQSTHNQPPSPYGGHPQQQQPAYGGQPQQPYYGGAPPPQYGHQQPQYGGQPQQGGHYGHY